MRRSMREHDSDYPGVSKNALVLIVSTISPIRSRHAGVPKESTTTREAPNSQSSSCPIGTKQR